MTTRYMLKRRKAVSTVVAAVLLIAITVVAVAVVWTMVLPMLTPKAKIDIIDVVFEDTTGDGDYADKVTFTIQNTGTESLRINTDTGLRAYDLSGDPYTGLDFTRGGTSTWASSDSTLRYSLSTTDPEPSSSSYYSLDAGTSVRITVTLRSDYEDDMRWRDGYTVRIKVFLSDGTEFVKAVTVDI